MTESTKSEIAKIYKFESGRVLASLVGILGDYDLAEEARQTAFEIALEKWPREGIPKNPTSWLISTGRFKAIDLIRREKRGKEILAQKGSLNNGYYRPQIFENQIIEDDQLKLIFYCCQPDLPLDL